MPPLTQGTLFGSEPVTVAAKHPIRHGPLLKWIGSKHRYAPEIVSYFPTDVGTYFEPFLGGGAVLGALAPKRAVGSDTLAPLIQIWVALRHEPDRLKDWYAVRWEAMAAGDKVAEYERVKAAYNARPNGADLLYLSRTCYGGVVRFRKDGYMSTPCGSHNPISPETFARRVDEWHGRTLAADFRVADFADLMGEAKAGDLIYCDPPYLHSQAILYGSQDFGFVRLLEAIGKAKDRGARVALSIDGSKRSGAEELAVVLPEGLFERQAFITGTRSMLLRFQKLGEELSGHVVSDRLLLTW